ncbi:MAG TPA: DUF6049 family protein [Acidimicrobiales bacterium]|nr:DUF6049 family protein [Acidimicrobiales bacterium]
MIRRRVRLAGLVGLVLLGLLGSGGAPAGARPSGLPHDPVGSATQAAPSLELVRQTPWVHPGEAYTVDLRVTGAPAGATLELVVHDLVGSRAEFREALDGELGGTEHTVAPQAVDALTTSPGVAQIGFTAGPGGVSLPSRGVYPVELRLRAGGEIVASTVTYLAYLTPGDFPPLEVGVVVEIAAPPALQPDGTTELSPESSAHARQRIEAVEAAGPTPLTLAPLPETVEGLADAGGEDAALVDRLRQLAATRQVLARPFVDIDLASLQDAGLESEAYAQSDGGANVARSRLAVEPAGGVWLSGATWRPEAARWAVEIGFDRAIVPSTAVGDGEGEDIPTTPVRLGDDGPLAVVTDPDLADHLTSDDGMVAAHRFIAELTAAWLEAPSDPRAMVVQIPPDADIDPEVVGTALAALNDGQAVQAVPVTQIFSDVPPAENGSASVDLASAERGPDLRPLAPRIESVRGRIGGVAGLLDDPSVQTSLDHALFMSTGVATPDADRAAYVDWVEAQLQTVTGAVSLPDEFRITLTTRSSTIPVNLTNNTERDLQVRVELDSDQLEFPDGDVLTPTLPPGTTHLDVRVRARTSGAFTLVVTVSSPDDTLVLDRSTFDIRSTAISGVGLLLSVGAGLFLAIWWGRHWYRTRRARRAEGTEPPPPAAGGPDLAPAPARDAAGRTTASIAPWAARSAAPSPPPPPAGPGAPAAPAPPPGPKDQGGARRSRRGEPYRPAHMARPRSRSGPGGT